MNYSRNNNRQGRGGLISANKQSNVLRSESSSALVTVYGVAVAHGRGAAESLQLGCYTVCLSAGGLNVSMGGQALSECTVSADYSCHGTIVVRFERQGCTKTSDSVSAIARQY